MKIISGGHIYNSDNMLKVFLIKPEGTHKCIKPGVFVTNTRRLLLKYVAVKLTLYVKALLKSFFFHLFYFVIALVGNF